jgi:hypothetical protein
MTGYRRVLTCGEPCAEDFECISCAVDGTSGVAFSCSVVTGDTICPDTYVVAVSAPAIDEVLSCGFEDCIDIQTIPSFSTNVTVTKTASQNCFYSGSSGTLGTYSQLRCGAPPISHTLTCTVNIQVPILLPSPSPSILTPCPAGEVCEGYSILCSVSGGYGFAVSYLGNSDISCSDTVRCYNEYGVSSGVISSWVECTAFGSSSYCCDGNPYYQPKNLGINCTNQATGLHSCSLPTGFTIGRPV